MYYLSTQQNTDGSFGRYNYYENTAEVVFALSDFKLTNNDQYTAAVNFFLKIPPGQFRESDKGQVLVGLGQPTLLDEIIAQKIKMAVGGLQSRYASDVETTAQVAGRCGPEIILRMPCLKLCYYYQ